MLGMQVSLLFILWDRSFIHSLLVSPLFLIALTPKQIWDRPIKTRKGSVRRGLEDKTSHCSGMGTEIWAGQGKRRWIFPLMKGALNSWTSGMCFPLFGLPLDQPKAVGGWMSLPVSSRLFLQTYILRGLIVGALFFLPPQEESFVRQLNQAVWQAKAFHFRTRFGPQNKRNIASFPFSWRCFLPQRLNWSVPTPPTTPDRNTEPTMTQSRASKQLFRYLVSTPSKWMQPKIALVYVHNGLCSFRLWDLLHFQLIGKSNPISLWVTGATSCHPRFLWHPALHNWCIFLWCSRAPENSPGSLWKVIVCSEMKGLCSVV